MFEAEPPEKESRRVQRNRTFREILFGMKMKSKAKKEKADKQRDKKTAVGKMRQSLVPAKCNSSGGLFNQIQQEHGICVVCSSKVQQIILSMKSCWIE